jgi:hypothetical protein
MQLSRVRSQAYMLARHIYGARNANALLSSALLLETVRGIIEHIDQNDVSGFSDDYSKIFDQKPYLQEQTLRAFFAKEVKEVSLVELQDYFESRGLIRQSPKFRQPSALYFELNEVNDWGRSNSNVGAITVDGQNVAAWAYNLH